MAGVRATRAGGLVLAAGGLLLATLRFRPSQERPDAPGPHGTLAGMPYDLRPPTLAKERAAWWQPGDPRWLLPKAYGWGWSLNLARLTRAERRQS